MANRIVLLQTYAAKQAREDLLFRRPQCRVARVGGATLWTDEDSLSSETALAIDASHVMQSATLPARVVGWRRGEGLPDTLDI